MRIQSTHQARREDLRWGRAAFFDVAGFLFRTSRSLRLLLHRLVLIAEERNGRDQK